MTGFEVHKANRDFEQACKRLEQDELVCEENKKLILSFCKTLNSLLKRQKI